MANCINGKKHKWRFKKRGFNSLSWFKCARCGVIEIKESVHNSEKRNMRRSERMIKVLGV